MPLMAVWAASDEREWTPRLSELPVSARVAPPASKSRDTQPADDDSPPPPTRISYRLTESATYSQNQLMVRILLVTHGL